MDSDRQYLITYLMWGLLLVSAVVAIWNGTWSVVFIALATLFLTLLPVISTAWTGVRLPAGFIAAVVFFITGTLFLGEVGDFYERFWWWDVLLHTGSAVGFGMLGTVLVVMLARGDRMAISPAIGALFAFSFAVSIGTIWEIFEFAMDQFFGLNMQKSGLMDTMADLIVDTIGAGFGATIGYLYLSGNGEGKLSGTIRAIVDGILSRKGGPDA